MLKIERLSNCFWKVKVNWYSRHLRNDVGRSYTPHCYSVVCLHDALLISVQFLQLGISETHYGTGSDHPLQQQICTRGTKGVQIWQFSILTLEFQYLFTTCNFYCSFICCLEYKKDIRSISTRVI